MPEIKVSRSEFERWLLTEHKSVFTSESQVRDFLASGMVFLLVSGSSLLKSYILRRVRLTEDWGSLPKTASSQARLWWIFSQAVESIQADKDSLTIVYKSKEKYRLPIKYAP
ncbi:MAG: hypothetical protein DRO52_00595 [Candidatus Hecatellales archaeon]|nr:MAG: hypothetical protein DRO52_00595 [Candidatus Hecatellales archaeon]